LIFIFTALLSFAILSATRTKIPRFQPSAFMVRRDVEPKSPKSCGGRADRTGTKTPLRRSKAWIEWFAFPFVSGPFAAGKPELFVEDCRRTKAWEAVAA
jgi:hypothetical protein